ncbi:GNAT family N-acetyltransferase [Luteimonas sp. e5]
MSHDIQHDPAQQRFQLDVDGHAAHLDYVERDGVIAITHTIVPAAIGGRGIAGKLVQAALEHARAAGLKVDPQCSYADAWIRRHPDYEPLRA